MPDRQTTPPRARRTTTKTTAKTGKPAKNRWTAAERAERGRTTDRRAVQSRASQGRPGESRPAQGRSNQGRSSQGRVSGGRFDAGRNDRFDRARSGDDHPERSGYDRPERSGYDRPERSSYDRPDRSGSDRARTERPARQDWNDRPARTERPDWKSRTDRPARQDWNDRPARTERPDWKQRTDRPARQDWNDRPARTERPDWKQRTDRPARQDWNDRPARTQRPDWQQRSDRPARQDWNDRPPRREWTDRPARTERPSGTSQNERPARREWTDRPARTERPDWKARTERPARQDWKARPPRREPRDERFSEENVSDEQFEAAMTDTETLATPSVPAPAVPFAEFGLPTSIVDALAADGIINSFPIQSATIPDALSGRDVLGRGQTGSGKTLAFGLPMLTRLAAQRPADGAKRHRARAVVLLPTRELAMQVHDALAPLAAGLDLSMTLVAGGMAYAPQERAFERGVDVVIATPGRLLDLMERGTTDLSAVEITVLDEADHMADLGFLPAVTMVLDTVPADGQRLLFSATLDGATNHLVKTYLSDPVTHEVDSGRASVTTMDHRIVHVHPSDKQTLTSEIAGREGRTVVFVRTQLGAERVADQLRDSGVLAGALHGGLTQSVRTRILAAFKDGELPVLVATDVAARGIHVDDVGLVLQVDPPAGPKEYLHRAGRTARAGGRGVVVTLTLPQQRRDVRRLTLQAGVRTEPMIAGPGDRELSEVTGAQKLDVPAITRADYDKVIAPRRPVRADRGAGRPNRSRPKRHGADVPGRGRNPRQARGPRP